MKWMPRWGEEIGRTQPGSGRPWGVLLLGLALAGGTIFSALGPAGCDQDRKITDRHEQILQDEEE